MAEPTCAAALSAAAIALRDVSPTARLDAELLMALALGCARESMLLGHLDQPAPAGFAALVARRMTGEPIAYITGERDFWTISLRVGPGVLIPRADSETLIEAALEVSGINGPQRILDLGTGSGALLLAALAQWPGATGIGVDVSPAAIQIASANAARLGLADRASFVISDWGTGIDDPFDLILCNPPYIETGAVLPTEVVGYEPPEALFSGPDGGDAYRLLSRRIGRWLTRDGAAVFEIGATQAEFVSRLFVGEGYDVAIRRDLAGRDRALIIRRGRS